MREGVVYERVLEDGREVVVYPMIYTARLCIGDPESQVLDDVWCYHTVALAIAAAEVWNGGGEPTGWHRHPGSGRRRPDGDPAKEYVNL